MEAMWKLAETTGPGYAEVIQKYPDTYELRQGHVWHTETNNKLAHSPICGRPISETSIVIRHDTSDTSKLKLTLGLAKLLEENDCSDFSENPSKEVLETIHEYRF